MSKRKTSKASQKTIKSRHLKQRIEAIVSEARGRAFNEVLAIAAKENPNGSAFWRWFGEAWQNAPIGRR